ncbi:MAG: HlyD family efflux transporter periplasmic adaptor subunit [Phycisphaerae bacterium]|nr:HlyD family efflux transporter periplasmic adaptor subunit [Phycisphaerae bacterium]
MSKRVIVSIVLGAVVLAIAIGAVVLMMKLKPEAQKRRPVDKTAKVVAPVINVNRNYGLEILGYGSAEPSTLVEISSKVAGEINFKSPLLNSGLRVQGPDKKKPSEQGDILFSVDPKDFELAVQTAASGIDLLNAKIKALEQEKVNLQEIEKIQAEMFNLDKQQFQRVMKLLERGASARNEADVSKMGMLATKEKLQATRNQLQTIGVRKMQLEAELKQATVNLEQAKENLSDTVYRAPVTGRILKASADLGEHVSVGQVLGELYGMDILEIPVSITAGDMRWLDPEALQKCLDPRYKGDIGITAKVEWIDAATDTALTWTGRVARVEAGLEAQTRTAKLIVQVNNSAQGGNTRKLGEFGMLDLNMYCKVTIQGRTVPEAFLIPRGAILPGSFVYMVKDGKLAKQKITVRRYSNGFAMLYPEDGVADGDRIITSYIPKPVIGMSIQIIQEAKD